MKWSRYNVLFESKRHGWLLFNTVSRSFVTLEDDQIDTIRDIMDDVEGYDYSNDAMLYMQLRSMGFIVEDTADDDFYNVAKMRNLTQLYAGNTLMLTVAVTQACNFDCSYCFEGNKIGKTMSDAVEDRLIAFIKGYKADKLSITWYGGEPLMAYDRILSINKRLKDIGKKYDAGMITNGYLMTKERAESLNDLHVTYLQITLDGGAKTHNSRRYLKGGGETYEKILEGIDNVMNSSFKGMLHLRVNVDARNEEEFVEVYKYMQDKYPNDFGKRLSVYPGFVKGDDHPDVSCFFDAVQQGEFVSKMYEKYNIAPLIVYPARASQQCTLTKRNAFVVGPAGELYKCWDDVGVKERIVGTLSCNNNWNIPLIAEGMVACSYLDSEECKNCLYFPICNGGCHRIRQNNLHTENPHSPCTYFKGNMENLLELYYEKKLKMVEENRKKQAEQKEKEQNVRSI